MAKIQGFILYRFYYKDYIAYLGRTKQPLQNRIRGHLFNKPMHRKINIDMVTKIEYAEFKSEADMNLYEIYFINLYKPPLNVDDKCRDNMTVTLPEVEWKTFECDLWEKWMMEIHKYDSVMKKKWNRYDEVQQEIRVLRSRHRMNEIGNQEFEEKFDRLKQEYEQLHNYLYKN